MLFAGVAAGLLIGLSLASKQVAFAIAAGFLLVVALVLSGNPRLFALWCLLLSAPLGIKKARRGTQRPSRPFCAACRNR